VRQASPIKTFATGCLGRKNKTLKHANTNGSGWCSTEQQKIDVVCSPMIGDVNQTQADMLLTLHHNRHSPPACLQASTQVKGMSTSTVAGSHCRGAQFKQAVSQSAVKLAPILLVDFSENHQHINTRITPPQQPQIARARLSAMHASTTIQLSV
jgi:hypothetical protein